MQGRCAVALNGICWDWNKLFNLNQIIAIELIVRGWFAAAEPSEGGAGRGQKVSDGTCESSAESVPWTAHSLAGGQGTLPHRGEALQVL